MPKKTQPAQAKERRIRVWIELERPIDDAHGNELAEKTTKMLRHLNIPIHRFFWNPNKRIFGIITSEAQTFLDCVDWGHWFDLDRILANAPETVETMRYAFEEKHKS